MFVHVKLEMGIPKAVGDTNSAEQGIVESIDLTSGGASGYGLDPVDGWQPQIAQTKSGLWGDSETVDGRTLIAQRDQNVVETLTFSVHSGSAKDTAFLMNRLRRLADNARDFWQTTTQIEPVYMNVWFLGAPGPQYALIYNINISERMDVSDTTKRNVVITVEREPFWRGLRPGENPKLWTFYKLGLEPGVDFQLSDLELSGGTNHFRQVSGLANRVEHDGANTILTQNWIDFDAEDIDGDVPALMCIGLEVEDVATQFFDKTYWGLTYHPEDLPDENGDAINQFHTLNVADRTGRTVSGSSTLSSLADGDCNKIYSSSTRNYFREVLTAGSSVTYEWDGTRVPFTVQLMLGGFMVFLRGSLNNAGSTGAVNFDVTAQFSVLFPSGTSLIQIDSIPVGLPVTSELINLCAFPITYLGMITLPPTDSSPMSIEGDGRYIGARAISPDIEFRLTATNTAGANRTFSSIDVLLVPVGQFTGAAEAHVSGEIDRRALIDGTGYLGHGKSIDATASYLIDASRKDLPTIRSVVGKVPQLIPSRQNRLILMRIVTVQVASLFVEWGEAALETNVYINIIPRWRGVRDA